MVVHKMTKRFECMRLRDRLTTAGLAALIIAALMLMVALALSDLVSPSGPAGSIGW